MTWNETILAGLQQVSKYIDLLKEAESHLFFCKFKYANSFAFSLK